MTSGRVYAARAGTGRMQLSSVTLSAMTETVRYQLSATIQ